MADAPQETAAPLRHLFPQLEACAYFNSCSCGALAIPVREAVLRHLSLWEEYGGRAWYADGGWLEALDRARYMIVVLSPQSAEAHWVNEEIGYWLEHRGQEQLMLVLAECCLRWDAASKRFDPEQSDAAPPAPPAKPSVPLVVPPLPPWPPAPPIAASSVKVELIIVTVPPLLYTAPP